MNSVSASLVHPDGAFGIGGAEVTLCSTVDSGTRLSLQERCHVVLDPQLGTSVDHQLFDAVHGRNTERRIYVHAWDPSV